MRIFPSLFAALSSQAGAWKHLAAKKEKSATKRSGEMALTQNTFWNMKITFQQRSP